MTDIQAVLAEMRAALEAATPGPWERHAEFTGTMLTARGSQGRRVDVVARLPALPEVEANTDFLVLLHNKAAALLDVAEAADKLERAYRGLSESMNEFPEYSYAWQEWMEACDLYQEETAEALARLSGATPEASEVEA